MLQRRFVTLHLLLGTAMAAGLLYLLAPILMPFVAAAILAYLCAPLVNSLCQRKVPRTLAVVLVMLLLFSVILLLMLLLLPMLQREIQLLMSLLPGLMDPMRLKLMQFLQEYLHITVQLSGEEFRSWLNGQWQGAGSVAGKVLPWLGGGSAALLNLLLNLVLLPVVLFYLLRDWPKLLGSIEEMLPRRWLGEALEMAREADSVLAEFLRGQLIVMVLMSAFYSVGLSLVGLAFALPIGVLAGMLVIVPYAGVVTGLVLSTLAAVTQFTSFGGVLLVWAVFGAGQVVEGMVLTPRLVGERIGLHPVAVIFALLAFGQLFGFFGLLLALPLSAVLLVALRHARRGYLASDLYAE